MRSPGVWLLSAGLALALFGAAAVAHGPEITAPAAPVSSKGSPFSFGGPFSLVDHKGQKVTDKDFRGRFLLIYFGYASCPNICPTNLEIMAEALDQLGGVADRVQPVFISVDPDRDLPQVLAKFVANFHPRLIGLTGTEKQIASVAKAYRIYRGKIRLPEMKKDEYLVTHTPTTFLMGPDGKFLTLFPHDTDPEFMGKTLGRYLSAKTKS